MFVAVLDDKQDRRTEMARSLPQVIPDITLEFFDNAPDMIAWLARHLDEVSVVSLAYDLGPTRMRDGVLYNPGTGRHVINFLIEMDTSIPVVVHTSNRQGATRMQTTLERAQWPLHRVKPGKDLGWIDTKWSPYVSGLIQKGDEEDSTQT